MSRVWGLQIVGSSWELCGVVAVVEGEGEEGWRRWLGGEGWEEVSLVSGVLVLRERCSGPGQGLGRWSVPGFHPGDIF